MGCFKIKKPLLIHIKKIYIYCLYFCQIIFNNFLHTPQNKFPKYNFFLTWPLMSSSWHYIVSLVSVQAIMDSRYSRFDKLSHWSSFLYTFGAGCIFAMHQRYRGSNNYAEIKRRQVALAGWTYEKWYEKAGVSAVVAIRPKVLSRYLAHELRHFYRPWKGRALFFLHPSAIYLSHVSSSS